MDIFIIILHLIFIGVLLDYLFKPKVSLPSPHRIPIFGHLFTIGTKPHLTLSKWAEEHGNMLAIHIIQQPFVVLNNYESIYEAFVTKGSDLGGRPYSFRCHYLVEGKDIATQDFCPALELMKKKWHMLLKQYGDGMGKIENNVLTIAQDLVESFLDGLQENIIDPYKEIHVSVCQSLTVILTGEKYAVNHPFVEKWITIDEIASEYFSPVGKGVELEVAPWLRHFGNSSFRKIESLEQIFNEAFDFLKSEMSKRESKNKNCGLIFDLLSDLDDSGDSSIFSEDRIKYSIFDMIVAGVLTSTKSIYHVILLLAHRQDIQATLLEEIQHCLSLKQGDNYIRLTDKKCMPYTQAFLFEFLRYSSVVPFSFPHKILKDTSIQNIQLPKGMYVLFNLWNLHHSDQYWDNSWSFDPHRFLDEDGQLLPPDHIRRKRLMPFGAGVRVCLGQKLALARLFIIITSLIQKVKIESVAGCNTSHDPRTFRFSQVLCPDPYTVKFIQRQH